MTWGKKIRLILLVGSGLALTLAVRSTAHWVTAFDSVAITCDNHLTRTTHHQIERAIKKALLLEKNSLATTGQAIKQQFPCVHTITFARKIPHSIQRTVTAHSPLITVNNDHVLTRSGELITTSFFEHVPVRNIAVPALEHFHPSICASTIEHMDSALFDHYEVTWIDDKEIKFHDKHNPHFTLVSSASTLPNPMILTHYNRIKDELSAQQTTEKKINRSTWLVDIRFEKQIIVSGEKGRVHG